MGNHREPTDFATTLATAIARRGLTLDQLRAGLAQAGTPVSGATLSYWRSGRSLPTRAASLAAIAELEKLLNVGVGQLTSTLPTDVLSRWDPLLAVPYDDQVQALLEHLGLWPVNQYDNVFLHDSVHVVLGRKGQRERSRHLLRARVNGLDRIAVVFRIIRLGDPFPMVEAGSSCDLGRVVELDDQGLFVAELLLPRRLQAGELHLLDYLLTWPLPPDVPSSGFTRVLPTTIPNLVLDATLDDGPPAAAHYFNFPHEYDGPCSRSDFLQPVPSRPFLQVALADPPAGTHCLEWSWTGVFP